MKKIILFLILLLLPILVNATPTCFADELCTIYGSCKNRTYTISTATITIYFPNTTVFVDQEDMTTIATGRFNFTFIAPDTIGNYLNTINCTIGSFNAVGEDEFTIGESKLIADSITDFVKLGIVILFFLIHLTLVFLGLRNRITVFTFIGGIFGVIAGLVGLALLTSILGTVGIAFLVAYIVISAGFMLFFIPDNKEDD